MPPPSAISFIVDNSLFIRFWSDPLKTLPVKGILPVPVAWSTTVSLGVKNCEVLIPKFSKKDLSASLITFPLCRGKVFNSSVVKVAGGASPI